MRIEAAANSISMRIARWAVVGIGVSMPISTAMDNVLLLVLLLAVVLGGHLKAMGQVAWQYPAARAAVFLYLALICGSFYGGNWRESLDYLGKYIDIAFVPIFIWILSDPIWKRHAANGFLLAMAVVLVLSMGLSAGIVPRDLFSTTMPAYPVVIRDSITHNYLMAILVLFAIGYAREATQLRNAWLWITLALLGAYNVLFMIPGRTGQVVLILILSYLVLCQVRRRYVIGVLAAIGAALVMLYFSSDIFSHRWDAVLAEARAWQSGMHGNKGSSTGMRLDYYSNTLAIIAKHPWLGVGTGGFATAYDSVVAGTAMPGSNNPHNQYLLFTAQLGVGGLILFLALFATMALQNTRIANLSMRHIAWGVWIAMIAGNCFNSFCLNHTEGLFAAWAIGWATFKESKISASGLKIREVPD
jgi:O-antigen ligase